MQSTNKFSLSLATGSDISILAKISADSFLDDRHTQMKSQGQSPYSHEDSMREHLLRQVGSPNSILLKAVNALSGEITGWVSWGFRGFDQTEIASLREQMGNLAQQDEGEDLETVTTSTVESREGQSDPATTKSPLIERLEKVTSGDLQSWMEKFMPAGTRCMFVISLCVAPRWQSQGVGGSLLNWGIQQADAAGVFIWVHSSESAWRMYQKHGFEIVGTLDVDLDQYTTTAAIDNKGEAGKWGLYVFRYMKRLPRAEGL
ncbi:hypothetical protein N7493_007282 [Penicillium malachiteum]|uniref:N-acetyltransferase domain-containing protein n=1 Tax=Penicillium malachiteum TaxID=1324776 RepID=A0AAD6HJ81_9EURO|nr:hypothetical protein N7493_007282 [Penicillium malachiteum]